MCRKQCINVVSTMYQGRCISSRRSGKSDSKYQETSLALKKHTTAVQDTEHENRILFSTTRFKDVPLMFR